MATKVLLVEDDPDLLATLRDKLTKEGYAVVTAAGGAAALDSARREHPDLIVLDVMPPEPSGLEACRTLRRQTIAPVIMLIAGAGETSKIAGLETGADDCIAKPIRTRELLTRIEALLRRTAASRPPAGNGTSGLKIGRLVIDTARHTALRAGSPLDLTPKEFDLLAFLAEHRGFVFSREQLLERVWGYEYAGNTRTVDVHIRWLRRKIEADPSAPRLLITVRGAGYKLEG